MSLWQKIKSLFVDDTPRLIEEFRASIDQIEAKADAVVDEVVEKAEAVNDQITDAVTQVKKTRAKKKKTK